MAVVGYIADRKVLCPECLSARGYVIGGADSEGRQVQMVFATDLDGGERCQDCQKELSK